MLQEPNAIQPEYSHDEPIDVEMQQAPVSPVAMSPAPSPHVWPHTSEEGTVPEVLKGGEDPEEQHNEDPEEQRDEELAELLRQLNRRMHLNEAGTDQGGPQAPGASEEHGPGLESGDTIQEEEPPSPIEHVQWSQEFLRHIVRATLDGDNLKQSTRFSLRNPKAPLTPEELDAHRESLDLYFKTIGHEESVYEITRTHLERFHKTQLLSLHLVRKLVEEITGICEVEDDMCLKGCRCYVGPWAGQTICADCGLPRYLPGTAHKKKKIPQQKATTYPLGPQLMALRQSEEGSAAMMYRHKKSQEILEAKLAGANLVYDDIYTGKDLQNLAASLGVPELTPHDTLVGMSIDGAQIYQDKQSDTWFGIWIVYSRSPETRYMRRYVLPAFLIPGPNKPKHVESFLFRSFYHLSAIQRENDGAGLKVYDAQLKDSVYSRVFFIFGTADAVGLPELDGRVGHHGARGCRIGCPMQGRHKPGIPHYYPVHLKPNYDPGDADNPQGRPDYNFSHVQSPTVAQYDAHLQQVIHAINQAAYDRARKLTGISRPSLISALLYALPPPKCFTVDLMHLLFNNIPALMLSLWRGTMKCEGSDSKDSWEWMTFIGDAWKAHGRQVAEAKENFPSSFHRAPRDPSESLNSGYKATEYCLYFYGLGPGLFRTLLPHKYWIHYCKLVRGARILVQRRITREQMLEASQLLTEFVWEFEELYYQRRLDRMHFCRPCLHTLLHCAHEIHRAGPGCYTTQYTLEGIIGLITGEIRQHSTPYANAAQIMLRKSQWNAMQAAYPEFAPKETKTSKPTLSLGNGYVLLTPRSKTTLFPTSEEEANLLKGQTGLERVRKWGAIRLMTGQKVRSRFQEDRPTTRQRRTTRMIKVCISFCHNTDV